MSTSFEVWTFRDKKWYYIAYKSGKLVKDVTLVSRGPKLPHGIKAKRGTVVKFSPELPLFRKGAKMDIKNIKTWCELTSYLVPKLKVMLTLQNGKTKTLQTKGPSAYIDKTLEELKVTQTGKTFLHSSKEADVAVAFTDAEGDITQAYTNGLHNKEGGEHLRALVDALAKSLKPLSKKDKDGKLKYSASDLRDGLIGLVNYKISAPQFNNQPKDKLIDERVYDVAVAQFFKAWSDFWAKNKGMAKAIIDRAETLRSKTNDFLKDKKLIKNVKAAKKNLETKLAGVVGKTPPEERELFLVEGDSAGGGCKRARDKSFQAIYPCRGKPLNVMDAKKEKINKNAEIVGILAALGCDPDSKTPDKINYGKVILMADPDVDGKHINCLWTGMLWKYMPSLIKNGHVYVVKAPLYKCKYKGKLYFGMTKDEIFSQTGTDKCDVTYIKGYGELNESDLHIALDPKHRRPYKLLPPDKKGSNEFGLLLGKTPAYRKQMFNIQ